MISSTNSLSERPYFFCIRRAPRAILNGFAAGPEWLGNRDAAAPRFTIQLIGKVRLSKVNIKKLYTLSNKGFRHKFCETVEKRSAELEHPVSLPLSDEL